MATIDALQKPETFDAIEADTLLASGNSQEAASYARRRLPHPGAWLTLGHAERQLGHLDDALTAWKQAHALAPDDPDMRLALACGLKEAGAAYETYAKALGLPLCKPEFIASGTAKDKIVEAYRTFGCVLLRKAIPQRIVHEWRNNMMANMEAVRMFGSPAFQQRAGHHHVVYGLGFMCAQPDRRTFVARLDKIYSDPNGLFTLTDHIAPHEQAQLTEWQHACFGEGLLHEVISAFLSKTDYIFDYSYAMCRCVRPTQTTTRWHQDARLQRNHMTYSTAWIPFSACGPALAPSIGLVPWSLTRYFPTDTDEISEVVRDCANFALFVRPDRYAKRQDECGLEVFVRCRARGEESSGHACRTKHLHCPW